MCLNNAECLLRALSMLDWVRKKETVKREAVSASDVQTARQHVLGFFSTKCTHASCISPGTVWCVRCSLAFLSLRSPLVPGEHVRWNSPPIKTGISRVHCGNWSSVGKQRVCPSFLPSLTLSLILSRWCSSSSPTPLFLTSTVTLPPLFSYPVLCSPHSLLSSLSVFILTYCFL